jgi:type VI secretion system secreted protein VgrG
MAHENLHLVVEIEIEGFKKLENASSLVITQRIDWHHTFEIKIPLEAIEGERSITLSAGQDFIGKGIKIALKTQQRSTQLNFFKGVVTNVNLSRYGGNASDMIICGHSSSILLDDGPTCASFLENSLKQVVELVKAQYPVNLLSFNCSPTVDPRMDFLAQYNESNYNFIGRLAAQHGQWFFYNGTQMIFGAPPSEDIIELFFGHDLESFDLNMKVVPLNFEASGYDYVQNTNLKESSSQSVQGQNSWGQKAVDLSKGFFGTKTKIHNRELAKDNDELSELVANRQGGRAADMVILSGKSDNAKIKVGSKIKIQGASTATLSKDKTDYGNYIVTSVTHRMDGLGGYQNTFTAIPADIRIPPANANFKAPTIDTQAAVVIDNKDPDGLGRIKVRMYWQRDGDTTGWIRYMTPHAGKNRGFYILPEINDEVIVAFENGNLSMPFCLGSMYHGKAHSGDRKDDANEIKTIRTNSGNEIKITDKSGEEAIHIFTEGKKNEVLITMKDDGLIQITSNKNIKIVAMEDIEVKSKNMMFSASDKIEFKADKFKVSAQSLIQLESMKDFKEKGMDIVTEATKSYAMKSMTTAKLEATTEMTISGTMKTAVKGGVQLELGAGAMASLKAGIVQIN